MSKDIIGWKFSLVDERGLGTEVFIVFEILSKKKWKTVKLCLFCSKDKVI